MNQIITPSQAGVPLHVLTFSLFFCFLGFIFQSLNAQLLDLDDFQSTYTMSYITGGETDSLIFQIEIYWDESPAFDLVWTEVDLNLLEPMPSGTNPLFLSGQSLGLNPSRDFTGKGTLLNDSTFRVEMQPFFGPTLVGGGVRMTAVLVVPKSNPGISTNLESMGGIIMVDNMDFKKPKDNWTEKGYAQVWPNPFVDRIRLNWAGYEEARILVRDHLGRICHDSGVPVLFKETLDLKRLPQGRYVVQLVNGLGTMQNISIQKL